MASVGVVLNLLALLVKKVQILTLRTHNRLNCLFFSLELGFVGLFKV